MLAFIVRSCLRSLTGSSRNGYDGEDGKKARLDAASIPLILAAAATPMYRWSFGFDLVGEVGLTVVSALLS